eukprot:766061-Hanusia_phi.AAC.2
MAAAATGAGKVAAGAAQSLATHTHISSHPSSSSEERPSSHPAGAAMEASHLAPDRMREKLVRGGFLTENGAVSAKSSSPAASPSSIWILEFLLCETHISLWDEAQNRVRSLITLPKVRKGGQGSHGGGRGRGRGRGQGGAARNPLTCAADQQLEEGRVLQADGSDQSLR